MEGTTRWRVFPRSEESGRVRFARRDLDLPNVDPLLEGQARHAVSVTDSDLSGRHVPRRGEDRHFRTRDRGAIPGIEHEHVHRRICCAGRGLKSLWA